jgi:Na+-driven multidrug efflux pump
MQAFHCFGVIFGFAIGIMLLISTPLFLSFFTISEATLALCRTTIIVYAVYTIPKVINMVMVVGVLRSGGDTIFAAMIDVGAPWLIGLPMAFLGVEVLALPIYFVMAMVNLEELVKAILGVKRLLSDKWLNNLVRDIHHEEELLLD